MLEGLGTSTVTAVSATVGAQTATSASRREAQRLERPQAPVAPYISPRIRVDNLLNVALFEMRDSETGDVVDSFPSESQIRAFKRAQQAAEVAQPVSTPQPQAQVEEAPQASSSAPQPQAVPQPQPVAVDTGAVAASPDTTTTLVA